MILFTSHRKVGQPPVLIREGFCWAAAIFGWLYFLFNGAFTVAALSFVTTLLIGGIGRYFGAGDALLGLALLQGLFGRDLLRWSLHLRGFTQGPVVLGGDADQALARLLTERPDLMGSNLMGSNMPGLAG